MKDIKVKIKDLKRIKDDIFLLSFDSLYFVKTMKPGQFLNILIDSPELNLRRPFCIHHTQNNTVFVLFRIRGRGTQLMSQMKKGDQLNVLGPLGNGFALNHESRVPNPDHEVILVAGGMGVAPLLSLASRQKKAENKTIILGAATKNQLLCRKEFRQYGFKIIECTDDGSAGFKGNSVQCLASYLSTFNVQPLTGKGVSLFACGPEVMFKGLQRLLKQYPDIRAQASFEQFMGCGIGTCRACVIETVNGRKRVCKDGPVFDLKDIIF